MVLAVDTETTGLGFWDTAFCVTTAYRDEGELISDYWDIDDPDMLQILKSADDLVFHNAKFDLQKLKLHGVLTEWEWGHIHDTECMSHLLDEQRPKALKRLARDLLGLETNEEEELRKTRRKLGLTKADGHHALPRDVIEPYAIKDAEFTLLLYEYFWPQIETDPELLSIYHDEQELMGVLFSMEQAGLRVDLEYVDETSQSLAHSILLADLALRDLVGKEDFNPNSPKQIHEAFIARDIQVQNTSKAVLEQVDDELAKWLLSYRHDSKLLNTYFKALRTEVGEDMILHPNFRQWGTRGRRFSAGASEG